MSARPPYNISTEIAFNPLELIDVRKLQLETKDEFVIELDGRTVELKPQQGFTVPKGVMHRTRAPVRSVILMIEGKGVVPTGDLEWM